MFSSTQASSLSFVAFVQIIFAEPSYSDTQIDEILKSSAVDKGIYTTHSETHRPIHVPVYERVPVNVPHPVAVAVPYYVKVFIPQPYPKYSHVEHKVDVPVYKLIPDIIEKPVPFEVEKPFQSNFWDNFLISSLPELRLKLSVEVERPFPVQVLKKLEIPVAKPYPVHVVYYKHISEDEPAPTTRLKSYLASQASKYSSLQNGGGISAREHHEHQLSGY